MSVKIEFEASERIDFKVAPYALEDAVRALSQYEKGWSKELWVTKEDGDLVVILTKRQHHSVEPRVGMPVEVER